MGASAIVKGVFREVFASMRIHLSKRSLESTNVQNAGSAWKLGNGARCGYLGH